MAEQAQAVRAAFAGPSSASQVAAAFTAWGPEPALLLLYAPAFIYMLPDIPQWIGRIFPTYYLIQPVIEIAQQGGTWATVAPELAVLDVILVAMIAAVVHRAPQTEGALNPA